MEKELDTFEMRIILKIPVQDMGIDSSVAIQTPQEEGKNARPPFSRREELRQLVRYGGIHLRRIAVIGILRTTNGLGLRQHLLDERHELGCANGIVVEYLAEFKCEPHSTMMLTGTRVTM